MAAAGDADIGEVGATRNRRRTIYDYLGEGEDDGGEAAPASPETPPRLRLPRFTCARIRLGRKRGGGGSRAREELPAAADKGDGASVAGSSSGSSSKQGAGATTTTTGGGGAMSVAAAAAQTGMGLSMLLLLARTCVELNRMAEVRAQMEALLEEIRDEASRVKAAADLAAVAPRTCNNLPQSSSSSTTTTTASSSCVSDTSTNRLETGRGEDGKWASESEDEGFAGVDDALELEAEFEAEPARRQPPPPEWKCNTEQETPECSMESSDEEFIELDGGRFGRGGGGRENGNPDDSDDDGGGCSSSRERNEEGGVSAVELERRLHELRHRRDRERIKALEAALRRAERRVTEKEMEARLWQDTAALALGQPAPRHGQ